MNAAKIVGRMLDAARKGQFVPFDTARGQPRTLVKRRYKLDGRVVEDAVWNRVRLRRDGSMR